MSYVYGCPRCKISVETDRRMQLRCSSYGGPMEEIATSRWIFRCGSCGATLEGSPEATPRTVPCPFCDGGMMYPSRPG